MKQMTAGTCIALAAGCMGAWALMIAPTPQPAAASGFSARIGSAIIPLAAPVGFVEAGSKSARLLRNAEAMTMPANRLLAVFVSEQDLRAELAGKEPEFARYFTVQTLRQVEDKAVSGATFEFVRNKVRSQYRQQLQRAAPALRQHVDAAAKSIAKDSDVADYALRAGEMRPIEVFNDQPTSISLLVLSKFTVSGGGTAREQPVVLGLTTALFRQRVVYLYAFSNDESPADTAWIKAQTLAWVQRLSQTN